jgi:hypothetical protein
VFLVMFSRNAAQGRAGARRMGRAEGTVAARAFA